MTKYPTSTEPFAFALEEQLRNDADNDTWVKLGAVLRGLLGYAIEDQIDNEVRTVRRSEKKRHRRYLADQFRELLAQAFRQLEAHDDTYLLIENYNAFEDQVGPVSVGLYRETGHSLSLEGWTEAQL